jgi:predicted site-specific integrase-resolvase
MTSERTFLTCGQAAQRLQQKGIAVNSRQIRSWINKGRLPAVILPNGRAQIRPSDVDALLTVSA